MAWIVGSEDVGQAGGDTIPTGLCHAVDLELGATACDQPARGLHVWPDLPWRRAAMAGLDQCDPCVHRTSGP